MKSVNRRDFMKFTGSTLIGLTLGGVALRAQAQEQLSADDATAKALNYTPASTVDGAKCSNCMYVQGADGEPHRPCNIFPGKLVNANGWCSAWVKKPGQVACLSLLAYRCCLKCMVNDSANVAVVSQALNFIEDQWLPARQSEQ